MEDIKEETIKEEKVNESQKDSDLGKENLADMPKEEKADAKEAKPAEEVQEIKESSEKIEEVKKTEEKPEEKPEEKKKAEIKKFRTIAPSRPQKRERREIKKEFEEKVLEIKRVARVVKGGRRFKFRAAVVLGNEGGKVGIGLGKGSEVTVAVSKAVASAKKNMAQIVKRGTTIPYDIIYSFKGAKVVLKPAKRGTGIIAGGAVRAVVDSAGIKDISSKMLGSSNKVNNMIATYEALKKLSQKRER